jgi:hypothetical protein
MGMEKHSTAFPLMIVTSRCAGILLCAALNCALLTSSVKAQQSPVNEDSLYRIETHAEFGPLISHYIYGRPLPEGASPNVIGYNSMIRVMWHPNHLLAVGILTGYQLLVAEKYSVPDSPSSGLVQGSLHAVPLMIDETMQSEHFEAGVALGGYIITTKLIDVTTAQASRFELGMIGHASYYWSLRDNLALGPEVLLSWMSYRGIVSIAPQLQLKYVPFQY